MAVTRRSEHKCGSARPHLAHIEPKLRWPNLRKQVIAIGANGNCGGSKKHTLHSDLTPHALTCLRIRSQYPAAFFVRVRGPLLLRISFISGSSHMKAIGPDFRIPNGLEFSRSIETEDAMEM